MKPKNIILIGIILTTWYLPFTFTTILLTITSNIIPLENILIILAMLCVYIIGLITINMGLKKLMKPET